MKHSIGRSRRSPALSACREKPSPSGSKTPNWNRPESATATQSTRSRWSAPRCSSKRRPVARGAIDPDRLPPKDRLDHYRAERERLKLEAEQRLTLSATEVEAAVSKILKALAQQIETLPARLERDFGLTAAETARLYPAMDAARESLHAAAVEALRA
ncbi:MAG: DUF1441 family protein [Candidatus Competibacteraceae bacterium]|nr:DUF1441 family protein [Candidatus Competibacteraceae bacterium]